MANSRGTIYGLTALCPIKDDEGDERPHHMQLREYLAALQRDQRSPFSAISSTHLARLAVLDDVVFVGAPAMEEHLSSRYLVFVSNFDGDLDSYLTRMAREVPWFVDDVWSHCTGYPGTRDPVAFVAYMKTCQLETTFLFADVDDKTVQETLTALEVQSELVAFVEENQGRAGEDLKSAFDRHLRHIRTMPPLVPGARALVVSEKSATVPRRGTSPRPT
jgi:hypothetical protein